MGIKKVARPMNKAKNAFVKWLVKNGATNLDGLHDKPSDDVWDYYLNISGFIGDRLYTVFFTVWKGKEGIDYNDEENIYIDIGINEFMQIIN